MISPLGDCAREKKDKQLGKNKKKNKTKKKQDVLNTVTDTHNNWEGIVSKDVVSEKLYEGKNI